MTTPSNGAEIEDCAICVRMSLTFACAWASAARFAPIVAWSTCVCPVFVRAVVTPACAAGSAWRALLTSCSAETYEARALASAVCATYPCAASC